MLARSFMAAAFPAALLLAGVSDARADYNPTTGSFTPGSAPLTAANLNDAFSKRCALNASTCIVTLPSVAAPQPLNALFGDTYVVPDWFRQTGDGADDAPSIRRAQATGMPLRFRCRHYAISTPSTFTNRLQWQGCGAEMAAGPQPGSYSGTWLDISPAFQVPTSLSSTVPFTVTGATGSVIDGFGVSQSHPYPAANASSWTPNNYDYVFFLSNTGGEVSFRHTFWPGIVNGVKAVNSTRFDVSDMRGQWFNNAITVDQARDVVRISDFHNYIYWYDNVAVEQYQQAHLDTVVLARADTPFVSRLFSIPARSGIRFTNTGNGVATGAVLSGISCDFIQSCIWVDSTATGVTFQADMLRSFGQQIAASGAPVTMLSNSSAIQVDGQVANAQIGSLVDFGSSNGTINVTNASQQSVFQIGRIFVQNVNLSGSNTSLFTQNGSGISAVYLAAPPLFSGTKPSGYTYATTTMNGGLFSPSYSKLMGAAQ